MNNLEQITSTSNSLIKMIQKLEKKKERRIQNRMVVEGIREIQKLAKTQKVYSLVLNNRWSDEDAATFIEEVRPERAVLAVSEVFKKISYRDGVTNAVAICDLPSTRISDVKVGDNPLILILESVEKPGNIGAILRTADAAGVDAVLLANPKADLFNPNTIRGSLGTVFSIQCAEASNDEVFNWLKERGIQIISTYLEAIHSSFEVSYEGPSAIVMGTEATGISDFWKSNSDQLVKIPMFGEADSMNVSTSTAVMLYEAVRQRIGEVR